MIEESRFEIKYVISVHELATMMSWLVHHDAHFREPFPRRKINNLYFDLPELDDAADNLIGISQRQKLRLRWYGDEETAQAVIEYKRKKNRMGTKEQYPLPPIYFSSETPESIYRMIKANKEIPAEVRLDPRWLNPTLLNSYCRQYFISADNKIRVTIDSDIRYWMPKKHQPVRNSSRPYLFSDYVVEFKASQQDRTTLETLVNNFPYQPRRHSKYISGIARFYDVPYF